MTDKADFVYTISSSDGAYARKSIITGNFNPGYLLEG